MKFKLFSTLLIFIFVASCGYKNSPKSKDTFVIKSPDNVSVYNTEKGIRITNQNDKYSLIVEKAIKGDKCIPKFEFLKTIKPKNGFIDENVKYGVTYVYRLYNLDNELEINSKPATVLKTYMPPIKVKNINVTYLSDDSILIKPEFSYEPLFYKVLLNGKLVFQTKKKEVKLILENKDINKVKIIPYDEYDNKGKSFVKEVINRKTTSVKPPKNIKVILGLENFIIVWDKVKGAEGYEIYNSYSKKTKKTNFPKVEFKKPPGGCYYFTILSFNKYGKSNKKTINYCIP